MVVFVDFEGEDDDSSAHTADHPGQYQQLAYRHRTLQEEDHQAHDGLAGLTKSHFARVLDCYPAATSIACHLDLVDLDSLSRTCKSIRSSLLEFRTQLITNSLRCTNDENLTIAQVVNGFSAAKRAGVPLGPALDEYVINAANNDVGSLALVTRPGLRPPMCLPTKLSACARDLVAPCRKCGINICRNCAGKPLSNRYLSNAIDACAEHAYMHHSTSSESSTRPNRSISDASDPASEPGGNEASIPHEQDFFTTPAFLRLPCNCAAKGPYLCSPCAANLRSADTTYKRVWTWRSRYSTHIGGGLGTGLGQGDQGQKCGRGSTCLENGLDGVCWVEIDCSEPVVSIGDFQHGWIQEDSLAWGTEGSRPGYLTQEVEGIGGVVKKKVKRRIKVGATVWEYEAERESGQYLAREASGEERSWCGWCDRVCLGEEDRAIYKD